MKVSIAMATYNGSKYLPEQLQSFIDQTRQPDELVIVDDASIDDTMKIVEEFARNAPFEVHFYCNMKNLGYTENFSKTLSLTTGDLVFLSDQDDIWYPEKIETVLKIANRYPKKLLFINDCDLVDSEKKKTGLTKFGQIKNLGFTEDNCVTGCCAAVRRELLQICLPIPRHFNSHDRWIAKFAACLGGKHLMMDVLQLYRRHDDNSSSFIASRLSRVGPLSLFWSRARRASSKSGLKKNDKILGDLVYIESFIMRNELINSQKWGKFFLAWKVDLENQIKNLRCRKYIWQAPKYLRIFLIIKSLVLGHYSTAEENKIKAIGRDLFD